MIWNWTSTWTGSPDWRQHPHSPLGLPSGRTRTWRVPAPSSLSGIAIWTGSGRCLPSSSSCCCCPTCCLACRPVFCSSRSCCGCGCGCGSPPCFSSSPSSCPCSCCGCGCGCGCLLCCGSGCGSCAGSSPCFCFGLRCPASPACPSPGCGFYFCSCFSACWGCGSWTCRCCRCSGPSPRPGPCSCCGACRRCGCGSGSGPCWGSGSCPSCCGCGSGCGCGSCSGNGTLTWGDMGTAKTHVTSYFQAAHEKNRLKLCVELCRTIQSPACAGQGLLSEPPRLKSRAGNPGVREDWEHH